MLRWDDVSVGRNVSREGNKKITIFTISLSVEDKLYVTLKRYKEVQSFNQKLKKHFPASTKDLKLSSKKFFLTSDLGEYRRSELKKYVLELFSLPILANDNSVRSFFTISSSSSSISSSLSPSPFTSRELDDDEAYFSEQRESRSDSVDSRRGLVQIGKKGARPKDFDFLKVLGVGNFGKVLLARHRNENLLYAIKVVKKDLVMERNEARHVMAEREVLLKTIPHPFLVGLKYSFQTAVRLYFVLDYVNGGELFFHIQRTTSFSEEAGRFYSAEIASALGFLHKHNILYRDLKPENILLDREGHVRLTDFGLSKIIQKNKPSPYTFCGTPEYLAPEMIERREYHYGVDWWCLGSVLHEIYFGLPPFYDKNISRMYNKVLGEVLTLPLKPALSTPATEIIHSLLEKNSVYRLGSKDDFNEVKKHNFFATINWNLLEKKLLKPPFKPQLMDDLDLSNFDESFTKEVIPASLEYGSGENNHLHNYLNNNNNNKNNNNNIDNSNNNNNINKEEDTLNPLLNFKKKFSEEVENNKKKNKNYNKNNETVDGRKRINNNNNNNNYYGGDDDVFLGFSFVG